MSESAQLFADSAADYLGATDQRQRVRRLEDEGGGFDRAVWREIADLGWLSILVAEEHGGLGLGIAEVSAIAEQVGRHLLPEPFVDAGVHPLALLAHLSASPARDALLARLHSGDAIAGVAWQEAAGTLEVSASPATIFDADAGTLTGRKRFVRPGPGADGWLVFCRQGDGAALVWVDGASPGAALEAHFGVDGSALSTLTFHQARAVPIAQGDAVIQALGHANEIARIAQSAELAGIARRSLELTRDYLTTREQFGKPIGSFQALQHRLVDGLIQVELASACLRDVVSAAAHAPTPQALAANASRAKARCAHAGVEMTRMAIQLHGAIGTTNEYDVGLYFKRALLLGSRWGTAGAHRKRYAQLQTPGAAPALASTAEDFSADQDWDAMPEAQFRSKVRALFAAHYPQARRHMPYRQSWAESRDWYLTLSRLGWIAPAWPRQHGGMGLSAEKLIAYIEETEAWGGARSPDQGLVMVGPILMRFGNDAQRAHFLPPILAGEHVWTQGYSEPNAGSDLAAVRTEAVIDGDDFIVNGQKTWTTWGADGTHMFMLVRTDKTVKKQAGISFLLLDLKTPGVTVRPIRNIAGEREFCEVFFDDVRVPRANLVGELNQGWTVAKALLGFERLFTGSPKHSQHTLVQVEKLARQRGLFGDPLFGARFTELQLDTADLGAAYAGFAEIAKRGEAIPASISMLKIWSTETWERLALLLVELADEYGGLRDHSCDDEIDMQVVAPLFNCLGAKIFAGSNEIQRSILAKQVLELPS
ncbi:acyl-CoA dehydrogenase [Pantoea sp. 18069]|uniref:acyl-CoA dehydrogenase n=1 Tax=Pantoea sp. 18069 TaxID=2681415 RepID=UPI001357D0B7|nr:acyl-CoA dehydrogenase [Pantoea sp. 18069]